LGSTPVQDKTHHSGGGKNGRKWESLKMGCGGVPLSSAPKPTPHNPLLSGFKELVIKSKACGFDWRGKTTVRYKTREV